MKTTKLILAYDIGTSGSKTCLYSIGDKLELVDSGIARYPLLLTADGGAEQRVEDWWAALCKSTKEILGRTGIKPHHIEGLSFCCQMQGLVLVDETGAAVRNPMIYLDGRAKRQMNSYLCRGFPKISGMNAVKALNCLRITGGVAATPKDPLWKYHWVRENEPENFARAYKWLDVKDYLTLRCTGRFKMTPDSANITFLYDTRPGSKGWHKGLCRAFDVNMAHLPEVVQSTDMVGPLTARSATDLGLCDGIPVFGGGGDVSCTAIGAGCLNLHDTHIYIGTSGWVVSNVEKRLVDIDNFMASILGAINGRYNYVGEQETSGVCLQWVKDHLALDEIGLYLEKTGTRDPSGEIDRLYDLLNARVDETSPGAGNLIFTPWLHGNRAPREDAHARGMFFNISMETGKKQMIRSVLEGVAFHKRWILEAMEKKIPFRKTIRFVGGGAKSESWCQIMADVTGRQIETVENPQDSGAAGAAIICAAGLTLIPSFENANSLIPPSKTYLPRKQYKSMYDTHFQVFKGLYKNNKKLFKKMNP